MTHHYDYQGKTKAERRERAVANKKERMEQGKKAKMLHSIIMQKAEEAAKCKEARDSSPRR